MSVSACACVTPLFPCSPNTPRAPDAIPRSNDFPYGVPTPNATLVLRSQCMHEAAEAGGPPTSALPSGMRSNVEVAFGHRVDKDKPGPSRGKPTASKSRSSRAAGSPAVGSAQRAARKRTTPGRSERAARRSPSGSQQGHAPAAGKRTPQSGRRRAAGGGDRSSRKAGEGAQRSGTPDTSAKPGSTMQRRHLRVRGVGGGKGRTPEGGNIPPRRGRSGRGGHGGRSPTGVSPSQADYDGVHDAEGMGPDVSPVQAHGGEHRGVEAAGYQQGDGVADSAMDEHLANPYAYRDTDAAPRPLHELLAAVHRKGNRATVATTTGSRSPEPPSPPPMPYRVERAAMPRERPSGRRHEVRPSFEHGTASPWASPQRPRSAAEAWQVDSPPRGGSPGVVLHVQEHVLSRRSPGGDATTSSVLAEGNVEPRRGGGATVSPVVASGVASPAAHSGLGSRPGSASGSRVLWRAEPSTDAPPRPSTSSSTRAGRLDDAGAVPAAVPGAHRRTPSSAWAEPTQAQQQQQQEAAHDVDSHGSHRRSVRDAAVGYEPPSPPRRVQEPTRASRDASPADHRADVARQSDDMLGFIIGMGSRRSVDFTPGASTVSRRRHAGSVDDGPSLSGEDDLERPHTATSPARSVDRSGASASAGSRTPRSVRASRSRPPPVSPHTGTAGVVEAAESRGSSTPVVASSPPRHTSVGVRVGEVRRPKEDVADAPDLYGAEALSPVGNMARVSYESSRLGYSEHKVASPDGTGGNDGSGGSGSGGGGDGGLDDFYDSGDEDPFASSAVKTSPIHRTPTRMVDIAATSAGGLGARGGHLPGSGEAWFSHDIDALMQEVPSLSTGTRQAVRQYRPHQSHRRSAEAARSRGGDGGVGEGSGDEGDDGALSPDPRRRIFHDDDEVAGSPGQPTARLPPRTPQGTRAASSGSGRPGFDLSPSAHPRQRTAPVRRSWEAVDDGAGDQRRSYDHPGMPRVPTDDDHADNRSRARDVDPAPAVASPARPQPGNAEGRSDTGSRDMHDPASLRCSPVDTAAVSVAASPARSAGLGASHVPASPHLSRASPITVPASPAAGSAHNSRGVGEAGSVGLAAAADATTKPLSLAQRLKAQFLVRRCARVVLSRQALTPPLVVACNRRSNDN